MKRGISLLLCLSLLLTGWLCSAEEEITTTIKKTPNEYYTVLMLEDCEGDPTNWGSTNMDAREKVSDAKQGSSAFHTFTDSDYCILWRDLEMRDCPVSMEDGALEFWVKVSSTNKLRDGCFVVELFCLEGGCAQWWILGERFPTKEWVRVTLPFAQKEDTNFAQFDPESITRFRFVSFNEDFRGNDVVIDDVKIVDMSRKPDGSPMKGGPAPTTTKATTAATTARTTAPTKSTAERTTGTSARTNADTSAGQTSETEDTTQAISQPTETTGETALPESVPAGTNNTEKASFPWLVVIIAGVVVLAGGGAALWFFLKKRKQA